MSAEIPYWWDIATQIWVVLLIGCTAQVICVSQSEAWPRSGKWRIISMVFLRLFLRRHFTGKPLGDVTKCWLFSQANWTPLSDKCVYMNSGFSLHFLLQASELKGGKLREVVANHKHLHLPRLSSRSLFDELCPEERFRSQRRLVIYSQLIKRILEPWSKRCSSTKKLLLTISNSVTDLKKPFSHCSHGVQHIASCQLWKGPIHSRWNHSFLVWTDSTLK